MPTLLDLIKKHWRVDLLLKEASEAGLELSTEDKRQIICHYPSATLAQLGLEG